MLEYHNMQLGVLSKVHKMKLKYIFLFFVCLIFMIQSVSATTLSSSVLSNENMFKCQATTITATFSDDIITNLSATFYGQQIMEKGRLLRPKDTISMSKISPNVWQGTYGNDASLKWGEKNIVYTDNSNNIYSGGSVFVYGDTCTGTDVTKYTQVSSGMGRYTRLLYQENFSFFGTSMETSLIGWAIYPWIEVIGYVLYILVIFIICSTVYLKTQNVTQPLIIAVLMFLVLASTAVIPNEYRKWILVILALGIAALYYRVFVKE